MTLFSTALKAVLFDFDGVLGDTAEDNYLGWYYALGKYGRHLKRDDYFVLEGHKVEVIASRLLGLYELSDKLIEETWKNKENYCAEHGKARLFPEALPLVKELKKHGYKVAVVSGGTSKRLADPRLAEIFSLMDASVTGDDVKHGKPAPDPFLKAAEKLGVSPKACVVIENAPLGISAARAAGMKCIAVTSTLSAEQLTGADIILRDLNELSALIFSLKV